MSTTPPVTTRRPHSSATVAEARRLHDGGWSVYSIRKLMRRRGISIDDQTILRWIDPKVADQVARANKARDRARDAAKSRGRLGAGPTRSPEFRLERIRQLAALNVSKRDIARVMTFDFPDEPLTVPMVCTALETGEPPVVYRDAFARDEVNRRRREKLLARSEPSAA